MPNTELETVTGRNIPLIVLKRDWVCNPVTHDLKAIEVFKRFVRGCKPRTASVIALPYFNCPPLIIITLI
jgi:hypothetical protein